MSKKLKTPKLKPSFLKTEINFLYIFISLICLTPLYYVYYSFRLNGQFSLPFDDAFIHLTFAKNLVEYNSFSYYKNEMVTAGSSSPLFTFITAVFFLLIRNEFYISYISGIIFFLISVYLFKKINGSIYKNESRYLFSVLLIFAMDKKLVFFSVSGMETLLFIAVLLASYYSYRSGKIIPLSFALALLIWIRPEGMFFIGAITVDHLYDRFFAKHKKKLDGIVHLKLTLKRYLYLISVILAFMLLYFFFNYMLSGTIMPNTYYAKKIFYSPEFMDRSEFLKEDVFDYFVSGSYIFLFTGFIITGIKLFSDILKRRSNVNFIHFIFIVMYISAYYLKLPYSGLNGRYLVPLIPFYIMTAFSGYVIIFKILSGYSGDKIVNYFKFAALLACVYCLSKDLETEMINYSNDCRLTRQIHLNAAEWIRNNTSPDNVIATHEIGAIGFYSERKLIDIAGLVTPELIDMISKPDYISILRKYFVRNNADYLASLKSWITVDNENPAYSIFSFNDENESFDIYKYSAGTTHLLSKEVNKLIALAKYNLYNKNPIDALVFLNKAIALDSISSKLYNLRSETYLSLGEKVKADQDQIRSLNLFRKRNTTDLKNVVSDNDEIGYNY